MKIHLTEPIDLDDERVVQDVRGNEFCRGTDEVWYWTASRIGTLLSPERAIDIADHYYAIED